MVAERVPEEDRRPLLAPFAEVKLGVCDVDEALPHAPEYRYSGTTELPISHVA